MEGRVSIHQCANCGEVRTMGDDAADWKVVDDEIMLCPKCKDIPIEKDNYEDYPVTIQAMATLTAPIYAELRRNPLYRKNPEAGWQAAFYEAAIGLKVISKLVVEHAEESEELEDDEKEGTADRVESIPESTDEE